MIRWRLVLEEFGPNIYYITRVENKVSYTLSRLPSTSVDKYMPSKSKAQCRVKELFAISKIENNTAFFSKCEKLQQKESRKVNFKPST